MERPDDGVVEAFDPFDVEAGVVARPSGAELLGAGVATAWREYGVQPWRVETFKFSTDPELVGKVTDVVGLYFGTTGEHDRALRG